MGVLNCVASAAVGDASAITRFAPHAVLLGGSTGRVYNGYPERAAGTWEIVLRGTGLDPWIDDGLMSFWTRRRLWNRPYAVLYLGCPYFIFYR